MSGAALEYNLGEIKALKNLLNRVSRRSVRPLMESLGEEVEEQTRERFTTKKGPGGPWVDWSTRYASRVTGGGSLLVQRGSNGLEGSIRHEMSGGGVLIGSHMVHAATHQYGDDEERNIPSRPYLGITHGNEADLVDIVNDFLGGLFKGSAA